MSLGVPQNLWCSPSGGNLSLVPSLIWVLIHFLPFVPWASHWASCHLFFLISRYWDQNPSCEQLLGSRKEPLWVEMPGGGLHTEHRLHNVTPAHYLSSLLWSCIIADAWSCPNWDDPRGWGHGSWGHGVMAEAYKGGAVQEVHPDASNRGCKCLKNLKTIIKPAKMGFAFHYHHVLLFLNNVTITYLPWKQFLMI